MRLCRTASVLLIAAALPGVSHADRIVLKNGSVIRSDHWWIEKDTLFYDSAAGSVGIPRTLVSAVEPTPSESAVSEPTEPEKPRLGVPAPTGAGPLAATEKVELRDLMEEGLEAFKRRDFERASSIFERAFGEKRALAAARVGFARSEMALGRDERALPAVLEGLSLDAESAELQEVLGDLKDQEEQVEEALRAWREAFRLKPSDRVREKIEKGEREQHAGRDYAFSAAPHFNVRYDGKIEPDLVAAITEQLETSYRELSDTFRHAPTQPITVLLYPEQQFRDVTQAPDSIVGIYDGKIRVPLGGIKRIDESARRVLIHELSHAVVHAKTRGNCPRWLQEGLAQRSEGRALSQADRKGVARLLRTTDPGAWESQGFSYAAALSLTQYLDALQGNSGLVDLLERLGQGKSPDEALAEVYGSEYRELCRRWAETLLQGGT